MSPRRTVSVPSHILNPETQDDSAKRFIGWANNDLARAAQREGERREICILSAHGMMGMACYCAERAAELRGHRFTLLPNRDTSVDWAFEQRDGARISFHHEAA